MKKIKLNIQLFGASESISVVSCTQNISGNYSTIKIRGTLTSTGEVHNYGGAYMKPTISNQPVVGSQTASQTLTKKKYSLDYNSTVTGEWTFKVYHKDNGSCNKLTIAMEYYIIDQYSGTKSTTYTPATIPRASDVSASDGTLNTQLTINITRKNNTFVHTLQYYCGSTSGWIKDTNNKVADSATWTPPMSLANQAPSKNSVDCSIVCQTYDSNGNIIGNPTSTIITLTIPTLNPTNPTIGSLSDSASINYKNTYGSFIQSKSIISATLSATPQYTTIDSDGYMWQIRENNSSGTLLASGITPTITYDLTKNQYTSGTLYIYGKITDKRKNYSTVTTTISVTPYSVPKCQLSVSRINSSTANYIAAGSGTNIAATGYTANTITYTLKRDTTTIQTWTGATLNQNSSDTILDQSYTYTLTAQDTISGITDTKVIDISTTFTLLNFNTTGYGIGIGKASEATGTTKLLEVALPTTFLDTVTGNTINFTSSNYHDSTKQDKLTAGTNITIDANNVISASGGGGGTATDVRINGTSITSSDVADIKTYGTYNSSSNKIATMSDLPIVPTKTSDLNNDSGFITKSVNDLTNYTKTSSLAGVATSGSYNDLSNKPTIPTVNNATLTIQKNGTTVNTFTANASSNVTANITVPTKTSDLTNDDNVVKDASYVHTDNNYTTTEKNKLSGIASGAEVNVQANWTETNTSSDAYIKNKPTIPTQTSQLTNNSGFITKSVNNLDNYTLSSSLKAVATSGSYSDLTNKPTIPTQTGDLTNNGDGTLGYKYINDIGTYEYYSGDYELKGLGVYDDDRIYFQTTHNNSYYNEILANLADIPYKTSELTNDSEFIPNKSTYVNTHPENNPVIIPFIHNDIAFLNQKGGSYVVKYDNVTQTQNINNVFDGSPSYWAINPTGTTEIVIELTLHKSFGWTNTIYYDFGSSSWRAKNIKVEVMNSNYASDTWVTKQNLTNYGKGNGYVTTSHTPVGADNAGAGFNKIRFTFSSWQTATGFRISQLGVYNYGSLGVRETYMSRGRDDYVYRDITPNSTNTYKLGSSDKKWNNVYATTFTGNVTGNVTGNLTGTATKATGDKNGNDITTTYQAKLIGTETTGQNLKTINGVTLLGTGNITIGGGGTATDVQVNGTSITSGGVANLVTQSAYNSSTNKIATKNDIPTNTNQLTNGAGFITSSYHDSSKQDTLSVTTGTNAVTKISGNATVRESNYYQYGKVVEMRLVLDTTASTSAGSNVFQGTIKSTLKPMDYVTGVGFNGGTIQVGQISPDGEVLIRNCVSSLASGKATGIHFTYLIS